MSNKLHISGLIILTLLFLVFSVPLVSASEQPWEEYDFGGRTITISNIYPEATPIGPRGDFDWYDPDPRLQAHIEEIEEKFNCKIEHVEPSCWVESQDVLRTSVLAGDVPYHIGSNTMRQGVLPPLILDGYLTPLTDYIEDDYWERMPPESHAAREETRFLGEYYTFPKMHGPPGPAVGNPSGLIYNRTMLEEEGLPDPHDLWDAGEWTWDVFRDMCQQVTRDTSGDGEIDQYGLNMPYGYSWAASNYGDFAREEDGRITLTLDDPRIIESYEFLQELRDQDLIMDWGHTEEQHAFINMYIHELRNWHDWGLLGDEIHDEYGLVSFPMGPQADDYVSPVYIPSGGNFIPVTVDEDPRALIELAGALQKVIEPYLDVEEWREEFWHQNSMALAERKSLEIWEWMFLNIEMIPDAVVRESLDRVEAPAVESAGQIYEITQEGRSAATVLSEIQGQAQSILDELLDQ